MKYLKLSAILSLLTFSAIGCSDTTTAISDYMTNDLLCDVGAQTDGCPAPDSSN